MPLGLSPAIRRGEQRRQGRKRMRPDIELSPTIIIPRGTWPIRAGKTAFPEKWTAGDPRMFEVENFTDHWPHNAALQFGNIIRYKDALKGSPASRIVGALCAVVYVRGINFPTAARRDRSRASEPRLSPHELHPELFAHRHKKQRSLQFGC
jgi:hypothetical protein